jgi:hypothetical protein
MTDCDDTSRSAASRAKVSSDGFSPLEEFGITDAVIAVDDGSRSASAQRNLAKPFPHGGFCIEQIERAESCAWNKSVVLGSCGAIEWRRGRHQSFSGE